jgi:homoserine kinase
MIQVHLRLPATSANLGPGFDSLALALKLYLHIDAERSEQFIIEASGRDAKTCGATDNNLLIDTYTEVLASHNRALVPLKLGVHNEIPLGMGCGSSAAVRLAAVALASHFGGLAWSRDRMLTEASRREGHPDNAAACWLGGFVASASEGDLVQAISITPPPDWRAVLVMPDQPLATTTSRAVLPSTWSRPDVVANLQRVALLTAAFATGKADSIAIGMGDRLHQPFRSGMCPLLPRLLPLAGKSGIAGVALSGAGPAVLLLTVSESAAAEARNLAAGEIEGFGKVEFLTCRLENEPVEF